MKVTLLAAIMITGLLLSASSVYLNKFVFADDQWSDIAKRQQEQNARAAMVYNNKYQFNNLNQVSSSYAGLSSLSTDETTKGRDIGGQSQVSMENAMAQFDAIHAKWLNTTQNTGYAGLTSISTDEQARDRNTMLSQARDQTDARLTGLVSQLDQIAQSYSTMAPVPTTTGYAVNRQANVEKSWDAQDAQAAALLNQIWQIDASYVNLQPGATTDEKTTGRQLDAAQAYALSKAIQIFEEIHAHKLAATYASGYAGLTSSTTDEQVVGQGHWAVADRTTQIDVAAEMALQNAINFYNAYYPNTPLSQPSYSH